MCNISLTTAKLRQVFKCKTDTAKFKLFFLLYFAGQAALPFYLTVYLRHIGLSATLTGVIMAIMPTVRAVLGPVLGAVADKTRRYKALLMSCISIGTVSLLCLSYIAIAEELKAPILSQGMNNSSNVSMTLLKPSYNSSVYNTNSTEKGETNISKKQLFNINTIFVSSLLLALVEHWLMQGFVEPMGSSNVVNEIGSKYFGQQRLFGAIGFGLTSYLAGVLMDKTAGIAYFGAGRSPGPNYLTAFFLYFVINLALLILVGVKFKFTGTRRQKPAIFMVHFKALLCDVSIILVLFIILIIGIAGGVINYFLFWFLQDLGALQSLLGLSAAVMCSSELLVFPFTGRLISKLGHVGVLALALVCFVLRLIAYSVLYNPWLVLLIQPLHGITFAALWTTCVSLASIIAPPEIQTTMQSIMSGLHFGVGWGSGGLLGGIVYEKYGPRNMFRGAAVLCGVGLILTAAVHKIGITSFKSENEICENRHEEEAGETEAFELE